MSAEVLGALAGTLFPKPVSSSQDSSGASTPADEVLYSFFSGKDTFNFYVKLYKNCLRYKHSRHLKILVI